MELSPFPEEQGRSGDHINYQKVKVVNKYTKA